MKIFTIIKNNIYFYHHRTRIIYGIPVQWKNTTNIYKDIYTHTYTFVVNDIFWRLSDKAM